MKRGRVDAFLELLKGPKCPARSTVHRWLSGRGIPNYEDLIDIALILTCSTDELLGIQDPISCNADREMMEMVYVAFYSDDNTQRTFALPRALIDRRNRIGPFAVLRVSGNDMSPFLNHADFAVFDAGQTEIHSGSCYVLEIAGKIIVRRLRVALTGRIDVCCENEKIAKETVDSDQVIPNNLPISNSLNAEKPLIVIRGRVIARYVIEH